MANPTVTASAVPFNPNTQTFGGSSNTSMGTANLNSRPLQAASAPINAPQTMPQMPVGTTPVQPTNIPQSQNISTLGTQPINLPGANLSQPTPIINQADRILKDTAIADTANQTQAQSISKSMLDLIPQLQGQKQALTEAQGAAGLPQLKQNLQDLNSQILNKSAEVQKDDIVLANSLDSLQGGGILKSIVNTQQLDTQKKAQLVRSLKMADIGILNAQAIAAQGNIQLAQETAQQAVDSKYAPIKETLDLYTQQLKAIEPLLTADEKKQAREQQIKTSLALDDLKTKKEQEQKANEMIINAMPFAPQNVTSAALKIAKEGGSMVQVAQALGKYAGDYLGNQLKLSSIAENNAQIAKITADIKATQATIPNNGVPGSSSYLYTTLANSAVNKESLDATERQSVTKNLSVIDQLGSLQANIAKQNNTGYVKGNVNNFLAAIGQNADVGTINAQLQAIVPNLARGVYGEVGVLTDNDIANYRKTLPNLTSPTKQNELVMALTLKAVQNNLKNTLVTAANSKKDVSRFIPQYNEVTQKINAINDDIGANDIKVGEIVKANPQAKAMVEAMIKDGRKGSEILQALGAD